MPACASTVPGGTSAVHHPRAPPNESVCLDKGTDKHRSDAGYHRDAPRKIELRAIDVWVQSASLGDTYCHLPLLSGTMDEPLVALVLWFDGKLCAFERTVTSGGGVVTVTGRRAKTNWSQGYGDEVSRSAKARRTIYRLRLEMVYRCDYGSSGSASSDFERR
jgi:hypothetical protein